MNIQKKLLLHVFIEFILSCLPGTQGEFRRNFARRSLRCCTFSTSSGPSIAEKTEAPKIRNKKYPVKKMIKRNNPRLVRVIVSGTKKNLFIQNSQIFTYFDPVDISRQVEL